MNTLDGSEERGRRGRWINFLQQFDINPIHKAGRSPAMSMADYLSRVTSGDKDTETSGGVVSSVRQFATTFWDVDKLKRAQQEDSGLRDAVEAIQSEKGEIFTIYDLRLYNLVILCYVNRGGRRSEEFSHGSKELLVPVIPTLLRS